jgi:hypothetical protein
MRLKRRAGYRTPFPPSPTQWTRRKKKGRYDLYGKLTHKREQLQGRSAGFERDFGNLTNNPHIQSQSTNGSNTVLQHFYQYKNELLLIYKNKLSYLILDALNETFITFMDELSSNLLPPNFKPLLL